MKLSALTILLVRNNRRKRCWIRYLNRVAKLESGGNSKPFGEVVSNERARQTVGQAHQPLPFSLVLYVRNFGNRLDQQVGHGYRIGVRGRLAQVADLVRLFPRPGRSYRGSFPVSP